jgi:hypothetical protein
MLGFGGMMMGGGGTADPGLAYRIYALRCNEATGATSLANEGTLGGSASVGGGSLAAGSSPFYGTCLSVANNSHTDIPLSAAPLSSASSWYIDFWLNFATPGRLIYGAGAIDLDVSAFWDGLYSQAPYLQSINGVSGQGTWMHHGVGWTGSTLAIFRNGLTYSQAAAANPWGAADTALRLYPSVGQGPMLFNDIRIYRGWCPPVTGAYTIPAGPF